MSIRQLVHNAAPPAALEPIRTTPCRPRRWACRKGLSIIELLTAISLGSLVFGIATMVLVSLMKAERQGRRHVVQTAALARLAEQFRRDASAAPQAVVPEDQALSFQRPDGLEVVYRLEGQRLVRTLRSSHAAPRRETFIPPPDHNFSWSLLEMDQRTLARLRLAPAGQQTSAPWQVEAVVGRDLRFLSSDAAATPPQDRP